MLVQHFPQAIHHAQAEQGIAADLEEVVVQAHALGVEHALPDLRHLLLQLRGGSGEGFAPLRGLRLRGGQRLAVELAVRQARQLGEHDKGGGHHGRRQGRAERRGKRGGGKHARSIPPPAERRRRKAARKTESP